MGGARFQPARPGASLGTETFDVKSSGVARTFLHCREHLSKQRDGKAEPVG
jgi:hypothetical protein